MSQVEQGAVPEQTPEVPEIKETKEPKTINPQDHERALKDMLKFKAKAKELETTLAQKEQDLLAKEQALLEKQNDYKSIAEIKEKQALDYKAKWETEAKKNQDFWETYYQNEKKNAVFKEALKAGLRKEAESDLDLIPYDDVAIERTDQGRVLTHGVDSFVEKLKQTRPHWFQSKGVANINSGGSNKSPVETGELTTAKMAEIQLKDPKKARELWPEYIKAQLKKKRGS